MKDIYNATGFLKTVVVSGIVAFGIGLGTFQVQVAEAGVYSIAKTYVGLHERKHTGKLKRYVGVNPRRTPWCGAFVGAVVKRGGGTPPKGHLRALNWRSWGKGVALSQARRGDVVVVRTGRGHHVGFYAGIEGNRVKLLGGNQSNQVKVSSYRSANVRAVRRGSSSQFTIAAKRYRDNAGAQERSRTSIFKRDKSLAKANFNFFDGYRSGIHAVRCKSIDGERCAGKNVGNSQGTQGR